MNKSTGMHDIPGVIPLTTATALLAQKACSLILGMVSLISGTVFKTLLSNERKSLLQKPGRL